MVLMADDSDDLAEIDLNMYRARRSKNVYICTVYVYIVYIHVSASPRSFNNVARYILESR